MITSYFPFPRLLERDIFTTEAIDSSISLFTVEIVSHNVGFRPSREGGCRLDLEDFELGGKREGMQLAPKSDISKPRKAAVLHAYGIGK